MRLRWHQEKFLTGTEQWIWGLMCVTLGLAPLLWTPSCNCWETIWDESEGEGSSQWAKPLIFGKPITPRNEMTWREFCRQILANYKKQKEVCFAYSPNSKLNSKNHWSFRSHHNTKKTTGTLTNRVQDKDENVDFIWFEKYKIITGAFK